MASREFIIADLQGLTPGIDPGASNKQYVLDGRNFLFDSRGVKSAFGSKFLSTVPRPQPQHTQGIRIKLRAIDRSFQFDGEGVWEWYEPLGTYIPIYLTPGIEPYRWTHGYLAGYFFFAHPSVGIIALNLETGQCRKHEEIGIGTPENVIALAVTNGRLCVVTTLFFHWSTASDGLDFTPSLGGGGFQLISDRVPGEPTQVSAYAGGCLTWTSGGVMRSEFTGNAAVFSHKALNTEYRPVNSFCVVRVDDKAHVILDERGLFKSQGDAPVAFSPVFNEFLIQFIRENKLRIGQNLRLEWDELQRVMYVSYSFSDANPIYEGCFALYEPIDKWGSFNVPHYGIVPVLIQSSTREGDYYGYVDVNGRVNYWPDVPYVEVFDKTTYVKSNLELGKPQYPAQINSQLESTSVSATGDLRTAPMQILSLLEGHYAVGSVAPMLASRVGLNSTVKFGLFKLAEGAAADEMAEIQALIVRSHVSGPPDQAVVDYNLTSPDTSIDLSQGIDTAMVNLESINYANHLLEVHGTFDGLEIAQSQIPDEVSHAKGARYYTCSVIGVWHTMRVSADAIGDYYHIKSIRFTAVGAGRYQ